MSHIPVLSQEVLEYMNIKDGDRIIDATFGGGGHTSQILEKARCCVVGIDRDPDAYYRAVPFEIKYSGRFSFINERFSKIGEILSKYEKFDAVLFDFGCSSFQLDSNERGFSFMHDAPLDMRMSLDNDNDDENSISAMDVVNSFNENDIANILYNYGEETKSRQIASKIITERKKYKIETTSQLRRIIYDVYGFESFHKKYSKIDVSTKTFQAIRIFVNDELREIDSALNSVLNVLNKNSRILTISFHSLEDRIVKIWQKNNCERIKYVVPHIIKPSENEIKMNPRSRSAILRVFSYE